MIFITNFFILPLLIAMGAIDAWLWMTSIRLLLARLSPDNQLTDVLARLTNPLPNMVSKQLSGHLKKAVPQWQAWIITIVSLVILKHIFLSFVVLFSP
jgi:hypothetical protein